MNWRMQYSEPIMPTVQASPPGQSSSSKGLVKLEAALACNNAERRRVVSVVILRLECLPELRTLFGPQLYQAAMECIQRTLTKITRGRGFGARTGPTEFTLALPDLYKREALALVAVSMGAVPHFEFSLDQTEIVVAPDINADVIGSGESIRETHGRLRKQLMASITREHARLDAIKHRSERHMGAGRARDLDGQAQAPSETQRPEGRTDFVFH